MRSDEPRKVPAVDDFHRFPPGNPVHFFAGVGTGLTPWVIVWLLPIGAAVLLASTLLAGATIVFVRSVRGLGCGLVVAALFNLLLLSLLTLGGLHPV